MSRPFDVALALRQVVQVFVADSTPILALGTALVLLPALATAAGPHGHSVGTVLAVLTGLGAALFVTLVSFGTAERLAGRPLGIRDYVRRSIVASPPGFSTALLIGAGGVALAIIRLIGGNNGLVTGLAGGAMAFGAVALLPAVPLALVDRCAPFAALRRSYRAIRPAFGRVAVVVAVAALAVVPAALAIGGPGTGGVASGRVWVWLLFELLAAGLLATLPGVVHAQLAPQARRPMIYRE